jgi:hypothetical protein
MSTSGTFDVQACIALYEEAKNGAIVNIASVSGPWPNRPRYVRCHGALFLPWRMPGTELAHIIFGSAIIESVDTHA